MLKKQVTGELASMPNLEVALAGMCGAIYFRPLNMGQVADRPWIERVAEAFVANVSHSREGSDLASTGHRQTNVARRG